MAIVYRHIRLDKNEPFYIGIGKDEKRANWIWGRNDMWANITNKTAYEVQILFDDLTWDEACEKEKEFIALYGRKDLGTGTLANMTDGGEGVENLSEYTRRKISEKTKGRIPTKETRDKISNTLKGRKVSEESLEKRKNHKWSDDRKNKLSQSLKGHNFSKKVKIVIDDVMYESMKEASIALNIPYTTLQRRYKNSKLPYEKKSK